MLVEEIDAVGTKALQRRIYDPADVVGAAVEAALSVFATTADYRFIADDVDPTGSFQAPWVRSPWELLKVPRPPARLGAEARNELAMSTDGERVKACANSNDRLSSSGAGSDSIHRLGEAPTQRSRATCSDESSTPPGSATPNTTSPGCSSTGRSPSDP
jgi:hypothetical protein